MGALVTGEERSVRTNVIWQPVETLCFSLETLHATRTILSGGRGDLLRAQFATKYAL
ncbi:MAG: hypothetical protein ACFB6R_04180 [Alphaproteobacteria bacterium]